MFSRSFIAVFIRILPVREILFPRRTGIKINYPTKAAVPAATQSRADKVKISGDKKPTADILLALCDSGAWFLPRS